MATATVSKLQARPAPRPTPQVESISPERAKEYLSTMVANRAITPSRVISFALEMDADRWALNGETVKFNSTGNLIDGQHRLEACILAGKAFLSWVVRGVDDPRAFATIDVGKTRTHGDIFSIAGIKDANVASGAATLLYYYKKGHLRYLPGPTGLDHTARRKMLKGSKFAKVGGQGSHTIAKEELLAFAEPYAARIADATSKMGSLKIGRVLPKGVAVALYIIFSDKDPAAAYDFMRDLATGANLGPRDPVHVLREKILQHKSAAGVRLSRYAVVLLTFKAWNARRLNEKLGFFRLNENEAFPKVR